MIRRVSTISMWFRKALVRNPLKKSRSRTITPDKLSCREVVELVTDYLEASLPPEKQAQFVDHVSNCPGCTAYVEQVQQTIGMLHTLAAEPAFPETKEELLALFQEWKRK